jgi:EAL domain-containing protein (putative c-di-GMP-specific phosphodiesterase class I)
VAELDLLMIDNALSYVAHQRSAGARRLLVSANLALTRYREPQRERLGRILDRLQVAAGQLVIEVPEDAALTNPLVQAALREIRTMGVRLAVTDVGVRQSDISQLHTLRPDIVKLDSSLVQTVADSPATRRLVAGFVDLAHDLGAVVVGQGVETQTQYAALCDVGCDALQGYYLHEPVLLDGDRPLSDPPHPVAVGTSLAVGRVTAAG